MFHFDLLTDAVKTKILQSVTFVIAKTNKNQKVDAFLRRMKTLLKQSQDPQYGDVENAKKISFIMEYFSDHSEQIYLFTAA